MTELSKKLQEAVFAEDEQAYRCVLQTIDLLEPQEAVKHILLALKHDEDFFHEMSGLVHSAESKPMRDYVAGYLDAVGTLSMDREWAAQLLLRMLGDDTYVHEFRSMLRTVGNELNAQVKRVGSVAVAKHPDCKEVIQSLLQ